MPWRRESKELATKVKMLCDAAVELRKNCKKAVQELIKEDGTLLKQVSIRLLEVYKASLTPGILPTVEEVYNSFKNKKKPEYLEYEPDNYYREQHNFLLFYNEKSLEQMNRENK